MSVKTTDFPTALKKHLHDVFDVSWKKREEQFSKVFDMNTSEDAYEDELQIQGPDDIPQASEGSIFERREVENVRSVRYEHIPYKGEIKITREALDDYRYGIITDAVAQLARAGFRTIERAAAAWYYNAFGSVTSPDGVSVFNTQHVLSNPLPGKAQVGTNYYNGQLSANSIRKMRAMGRKTVDEHGSITPRYLTDLICGPDLEDEAHVQKESKARPGTADNDDNVTGRQIKNIIVLDFLSEAPVNAASMFFLRDPDEARNKFFWRVKPERTLEKEEASGDWLFRLYFRFSIGCSDWRGLVGSDGTGNP